MHNDDEDPNSITLNVKRSLSFNGKEVAVIPHSDIAGRYTTETRKSHEYERDTKDLSKPEQDTTNERELKLSQRKGMPYQKLIFYGSFSDLHSTRAMIACIEIEKLPRTYL